MINGGRIKQPYILPNHQQNKRCQHLQWTKSSIFSPLARCKDAKYKNMVLKLKQNSCNQKTNLHFNFLNDNNKKLNKFFLKKIYIRISPPKQKLT